ncbi:MAG: DUF2505 domain-containing protein [Nocardioides sp.]
MSKTIRHDMRYDASVEAVATMLADPAFREEVCTFQGVTKVDVTIAEGTGGPGTSEVRIDQWQPSDRIPAFAKKIVGAEINIVQTESWSSPTHGDITVTIPGKPGAMTGTASLAAIPEGTMETVELTVKVGIPLLGGKLEDLIAGMLLKALRAEHKVGCDYLSR